MKTWHRAVIAIAPRDSRHDQPDNTSAQRETSTISALHVEVPNLARVTHRTAGQAAPATKHQTR